jgi:hypothetical protein
MLIVAENINIDLPNSEMTFFIVSARSKYAVSVYFKN